MGLFWIPDFNSEFNMSSPQPTMQEPCYLRNINGSSRISEKGPAFKIRNESKIVLWIKKELNVSKKGEQKTNLRRCSWNVPR